MTRTSKRLQGGGDRPTSPRKPDRKRPALPTFFTKDFFLKSIAIYVNVQYVYFCYFYVN